MEEVDLNDICFLFCFQLNNASSSYDIVMEMVEEMTRELTSVDSELPNVAPPGVGTSRLKVHLMPDIREELRRRQGQMRDIDAKKTRVDRHVVTAASTGAGTNADKKADLKARLDALNSHMAATKTRLLGRISECSSMSADAEQFNRKYSEMKEKLGKGDNTAVSLIQHKVFQDICSRIVSTYVSDDTSEIGRAAAEVSRALSDRQTSERKVSSSRKSSQPAKVDALMEEFTAWLAKSESAAKDLLTDQVSGVFTSRLEELEDSIVSMDCEFNMLRSQVPEGSCQPLQQAKMEDISRRWKALQNSMLSLKAKKESVVKSESELVSETSAWVRTQQGLLEDLPVADDIEEMRRRASVLDKLSRDVQARLDQIAGESGDARLHDLEATLRALAAKVESTKGETVKAMELREKLQSCIRDLTKR